MSRAAFSTTHWKIRIKKGLAPMPSSYNQILLEGIPYSVPPKNKQLIKFRSEIYESAKEFAEEHKSIGYLNDGRLSQDSLTYSTLRFEYLKKGMSTSQASLQAKRDLIKKIETRAMELDMIQNQALRMGLPSYKPQTHLEHMTKLSERIEERRIEFEAAYRSEGLEEALRVKAAYNDFSALTFAQVSGLSPKEYSIFVKEHPDFKHILSQPVSKDKPIDADQEEYDSVEEQKEEEEARKATAESLGISLKDEADPVNILGFRLSDYNQAVGFKSAIPTTEQDQLTSQIDQDGIQIAGTDDEKLSAFESKMKDLEKDSKFLSFHDFKKYINMSKDRSVQTGFNAFKIKEENGTFKLGSADNIDQLFYTAQISHNKKTLLRLPVISSIQTMHHYAQKGSISKELLAYVNRDEGNRDKSGDSVVDTDAETLISKTAYIDPNLENLDTMQEITSFNEIPLFAQNDIKSKNDLKNLSKTIKKTISKISNSLFLDPWVNTSSNLDNPSLAKHLYEKQTEDDTNEIVRKAKIQSMKGSIEMDQDGYLNLLKTNIHTTYDLVDYSTFERSNKLFALEESFKEHDHTEQNVDVTTIGDLVSQEANDIIKGYSNADPKALRDINRDSDIIANSKFSDYLSGNGEDVDSIGFSDEIYNERQETNKTLDKISSTQERNSKLNIVNRNIEKEDKSDFRNFPVEILEKYKAEIDEFKAKKDHTESDYIEFSNYLTYLHQMESEPYIVQRIRAINGLPATPFNIKIDEFNRTLPAIGESVEESEVTETIDNPTFKALKDLYPDSQDLDNQINTVLYKDFSLEDEKTK